MPDQQHDDHCELDDVFFNCRCAARALEAQYQEQLAQARFDHEARRSSSLYLRGY